MGWGIYRKNKIMVLYKCLYNDVERVRSLQCKAQVKLARFQTNSVKHKTKMLPHVLEFHITTPLRNEKTGRKTQELTVEKQNTVVVLVGDFIIF